MTLKQRRDESPLLCALRDATGLGNVYESRTGPDNPRASWVVTGSRRCFELALLLSGTIRGKKASEFELWASVVEEMSRDRRRARQLALEADKRLKECRRYKPPSGRLRRPATPRLLSYDVLRALREFADEHDGCLDVATYMKLRDERYPEWPSRNTVARHFGTWHGALETAGLADRAAGTPGRFTNRSRVVLEARRVQQRERVLASVRRFVSEVGHVPRAMEYFRWRLAHDPDTPTQATVYNLFPGGWHAVLAALRGYP